MLQGKWLIGILLLMTVLCPIASAYSVSPAKWEVYMYEDYEITPQTKLSLIFDNNHNSSISIRLSLYNDPKTTKEGYEPLPEEDFEWIRFNETDITIPAHTKYEIPIIVDVPNGTENYNKSWQFYIKVDQYAGGDSGGTATFQYDYNLLWTIKTPPRYVPPEERKEETVGATDIPWLYIGIGIIAIGVVAGVVIKRRQKPGKKHEKEYEEDIFKK